MNREEAKMELMSIYGSLSSNKQIAIDTLFEQEPCEKQIKIGTKVRTIKDKDYAYGEVFPVGTIGIVERIDKGDNLPYKIVANNGFYYYSRDMFEIIEDIGPCDDAVSREAVLEELYQWVIVGEYEYTNATEYLIKRVNELPSVRPMRVENSKGERIAFGKVGVDKAVKILEILGE